VKSIRIATGQRAAFAHPEALRGNRRNIDFAIVDAPHDTSEGQLTIAVGADMGYASHAFGWLVVKTKPDDFAALATAFPGYSPVRLRQIADLNWLPDIEWHGI
jgi:hypothetical protein